MSELCFVLAYGLTKLLPQGKESSVITQLLQDRFPQSHCHFFDPFSEIEYLSTGIDVLGEQANRLIQTLTQCPNCSTAYQKSKEAGVPQRIKNFIVFIGHDLGGSVIKRALVASHESLPPQRIVDATLAIFFLGGLHQIPKSDSWERYIINLLSVSQRDVKPFFPILPTLATAQTSIAKSFLSIAGSYSIFTLYDESDASIIPKFSATMDSAVKNLGFKCNHRELLDLKEQDSIRQWLFQEVSSLSEIPQTTDQYRQFLCFLTRMSPVLYQLETDIIFPRSLKWINDLESYQKWTKAPGVSFLTICGPPGSGVTVLTSNIVRLLSNTKPRMDICYLSLALGRHFMQASSRHSIVFSLIQQLLSQRPYLFKHTQSLCSWMMMKECPNIEGMWSIFKSLLCHIGGVQVLLAIRDVRECTATECVTNITNRLLDLQRAQNLNIKVIIGSENQNLADSLAGDLYRIPIEEAGSMGLALKGLVHSRLRRFLRTNPTWRVLDETIMKSLWGNHGDYYWTMAKVRNLELESSAIPLTQAALIEKVNSIPQDNREFFDYMLKKIPSEVFSWILEALRWVMFALRPLTVRELAVVVAFSQVSGYDTETKTSFEDLDSRILSNLPEDINRITGEWVKVNCGTVEIANGSLKSFLVERFMNEDSTEHAEMTNKCLEYISWATDVIETNNKTGEDGICVEVAGYPACDLLEYATLYWSTHCKLACKSHPEVIHVAKDFLKDHKHLETLSSMTHSCHPFKISDLWTSPLKVYAGFGLTTLVSEYLTNMETHGSGDQYLPFYYATNIAIEGDYTDVALIIHRKLQASGQLTPLHKAAEKGNMELLEEFLKDPLVKNSINDRDIHGYTPLFYAAQHSQIQAVSLLLDNNAEPDFVHENGWTAQHVGAKIGCFDIVRLLINHQADYKLLNNEGHSSLHIAAEGGFDKLVEFLLSLYTTIDQEALSTETLTTPLHLAAMYGHTSTCAHIVLKWVDRSPLDQDNRSPVYLAVLGNFPETVKVLLEADHAPLGIPHNQVAGEEEQRYLSITGNIKLDDEGILSPLQIAAEKGFVEVLNILLEYSYFIGSFTYDRNEALSKAAAAGQLDIIGILLRYMAAQDPVDSNGDTALHAACRNGHVGIVERLLESEKYTATFRNKAGFSSLHIAAESGHIGVVAALINGKWIEIDYQDSNGDKPIHHAAKQGHLNIIQLLQKDKDMSREKNRKGETPVALAALAGHVHIVKAFLSEAEMTITTSESLWGNSFPLHEAVSNEQKELVSLLVQHSYDVNYPDKNERSPLHIAAVLESAFMVEFLLQNGANPMALNSDSETALLVATKHRKMQICKVILEGSATDNVINMINLQNQSEKSALYVACENGDKDIVQLLIANNADPNQKCELGWTPLHASAAKNKIEIMELLFKAGADHDIRNNYKSTAIVIAAESGCMDAIRVLLGQGADPKTINSTGSSALHRATQNGHFDCVKILTEAGADFNAKKKNGALPLHLAIANRSYDITKYLIDLKSDVNAESKIFGKPLEAALRMYIFQSNEDDNFEAGILKEIFTIIGQLIAAKATMVLTPYLASKLSNEMVTFVLEHPKAFILSSRGESPQDVIPSRYWEVSLMMVDHGMDPNETGGKYHTLLQAAAVTEHVHIMRKLLEKNADPNIIGGIYGSALNAAVVKRNTEATVLLLENGARIDIEYDGYLPAHRAIKQRSIDIIKAILKFHEMPTIKDNNGRSLPAYAIQSGRTSIIDYLLTRPDVSINDHDYCGRTPLMIAVLLQEKDLVKKLLDMRANPNARDLEKKTPLIRAVTARYIDEEIVEILLEHGADPSLRDCRNRGVLYWACLRARRDLVENIIIPALKKKSPKIIGEFAFHAVASSKKNPVPGNMVTLLNLREIGLDLGEEDDDGWTAIYAATRYGRKEIQESLERTMDHFGFERDFGHPKKPTEWHRYDKAPRLQVDESGRSVTVRAMASISYDLYDGRAVIRANHCMPGDGVYYFEVRIDEDAFEKIIGIGFCEEHAPLNQMVGCDLGSWGYHGDSGEALRKNYGDISGPEYGKGDTIGCGVNFKKETAFFTKNGKLIGPAFRNIRGKLYPAVSFATERPGAAITANFGSDSDIEFQYKNWESDENTIDQMITEGEKSNVFHGLDSDGDLEWELLRLSR